GLEVSRPLPRETGSAFATLRFSNEPTAAFTARSLEATAGALVKTAEERLQLRGAVSLETTGLRSDTEDKRTYLVSFPLAAVWNSEDDPLNPARGVRASLSTTPTTGTASFVRLEGDARTRAGFGPERRYVAAFRARFGATLGTSFAELPSNERLYSGGGASVRGYGYQAVGALDANGDPTGGLSAIEGAFELRARVVRRLQVAAFVDAGSVSPRPWPDFSARFFAGAGIGVRYFSPAGPIRVDVATPVNGRDVVRPVQIYISLGQPF
ncbi:MAG: BamA/TamA family outer membrane protein, partial [Parvularculaceae bacterium]|nr:BamA/TamA family outer membrane protein [Parvularculaceae bacterium]